MDGQVLQGNNVDRLVLRRARLLHAATLGGRATETQFIARFLRPPAHGDDYLTVLAANCCFPGGRAAVSNKCSDILGFQPAVEFLGLVRSL